MSFSFRPLALLLLGVLLGFGWARSPEAAVVRLAWDAVDDDRVTGYKLHYGTASGSYEEVITVPVGTTQVTTPDLTWGAYYFAVQACGTDTVDGEVVDICSPFSSEVSTTIARPPIQAPGNLRFLDMSVSSDGAPVPMAGLVNPVVVASLASVDQRGPAVVQMQDGLLRVAEWEYLDGQHGAERAAVLVVDAGRYALGDGREMEAGVSCCFAGTQRMMHFERPFSATPVVFVMPAAGWKAMGVRVSDVTAEGFRVLAQRQQSGGTPIGTLALYYVAIEPGAWELADQRTLQVATIADVTHIPSAPVATPGSLVLAGMQTRNGGDTATARAVPSDEGVRLMIEEERSLDDEIGHTTEDVGVIVLDATG